MPMVPKPQDIVNQGLYELLALVDAIRDGRARERELAVKLFSERLEQQ